MALLAQLTINALIAGSIYALVASGFSMIYGANKFMHFAHGASVAVGGYILFSMFSIFGIGLYSSILITLIFSALFGLFLYRAVYLQLQKRDASNVILLVAGLALLILFENLIQAVWGAEVKTIGNFEYASVNILGGSITYLQILIIVISVLMFLFLNFFMKKTKLGKEIRAFADNKELASISGINPRKIADYSFLIGSFLAGIAGILIGLEQSLVPTMGTILIIKGFTGSVIGGITSVPASILGSYLLGFAENYGIALLPSGYKDAIGFAILLIFLLFRPNGLFGINQGVKNT